MCSSYYCKEFSSGSVQLPHQEDGDEGTENEEQPAKDEGAGGQSTYENVGVKAAGDWLQDDDESSGDWPKERVCHTHERAIPIPQTVEALDITEEGKQAHTRRAEMQDVLWSEFMVTDLFLCVCFRCGDTTLLSGAAPSALC